jgi:hypothetical protein
MRRQWTPAFAILVVTTGLLVPRGLGGQEPRDVKEGDRVRLTAPLFSEVPVTGSYQGVAGEFLHVEAGRGAHEMWIPLSEITGIEVSIGPEPRWQGLKRGMGWGALVGAVPAAIVLGGARCFFDDDAGFPDPCSGALVALAGGVWGTSIAVGAIAGSRLLREDWRAARLPEGGGGVGSPSGAWATASSLPSWTESRRGSRGSVGIHVRIPVP